MKIEFYREKFYLETIPYSGGLKVLVDSDTKKSLRYQKLFLENDSKIDVYSLEGINSVNLPETYKNCWVLKKSGVACDEFQTYDEDEIQVIKCVICHFIDTKTEITEKLCAALGDEVLKEYRKCYGKKNIGYFKTNIFSIGKSKSSSERLFYGRPRYSLLNLILDFKETKDLKIYLDHELIGKYKRISRKTDDGSKTVLSKWARFVDIVGNRTRANLSLKVISKVKVMIPENEVGVKPGEREFNAIRNFALVVDGVLNMEELGIKTSNTKLIGKLKRLGIVEPLLIEDEYLIDLTKLPVFSKTTPLNSRQLGIAEYGVRKSEIRVKYISLLLYRKKTKLSLLPRKIEEKEPEKDEATKFLESLGIYGDMYYPERTKTLKPEDQYQTTEIIGKVEGIPTDLYPNLRSFINSGSCKNAVITKILSDLSGLRGETDIKVLENALAYEEMNKKAKIIALRSLKFRMITGKTFRFADKHQPRLEDTKVKIGDVKICWIVKDTEVVI